MAATDGPEGFTLYVSARIAEQQPGMQVAVTGPLALALGPDAWVVSLERIYSFCGRNPLLLSQTVDSYVAQLIPALEQARASKDIPYTREMLRAVVRSTSYLAAATGQNARAPIAQPLFADLWVLPVVDIGDSIALLQKEKLVELGLSENEAVDIGKANTRTLIEPVESKARILPGPIEAGIIAGNSLEASRLLFPDSWTKLAERFQAKLFVAAPATDLVLYVDASKPGCGAVMSKLIGDFMAQAQRPLSPMILKWSRLGWTTAQ